MGAAVGLIGHRCRNAGRLTVRQRAWSYGHGRRGCIGSAKRCAAHSDLLGAARNIQSIVGQGDAGAQAAHRLRSEHHRYIACRACQQRSRRRAWILIAGIVSEVRRVSGVGGKNQRLTSQLVTVAVFAALAAPVAVLGKVSALAETLENKTRLLLASGI